MTPHTGYSLLWDTHQLLPPGRTSHANTGDETADETPQAYCLETVLTQENSTVGHLERQSLLGLALRIEITSSWLEPSHEKPWGDMVTNSPAIRLLKWAEATLWTGPTQARQALFGPTNTNSQQAPTLTETSRLPGFVHTCHKHHTPPPFPAPWTLGSETTHQLPPTWTPEEQIERNGLTSTLDSSGTQAHQPWLILLNVKVCGNQGAQRIIALNVHYSQKSGNRPVHRSRTLPGLLGVSRGTQHAALGPAQTHCPPPQGR